jgi:hypothetical protein
MNRNFPADKAYKHWQKQIDDAASRPRLTAKQLKELKKKLKKAMGLKGRKVLTKPK